MISARLTHQQAIHARLQPPGGDWNPLPDSALNSTTVALFEAIAARYPERPAVKQNDRQLTYAELNQAANRVAHLLLARYGSGSEPVALLTPLRIEALIFILGVLKAGRPYTAPDLQHPPARIGSMLANARPVAVVAQPDCMALAHSVAPGGTAVLPMDSFPLDLTQPGENEVNPGLPLGPDSLFCIIYTSGTTGQPKGVYCAHRAVVQRAQRFVLQAHYSVQDRLAFTRYPGFTPRDIFTPIVLGGTLFLFDLAGADLVQLAAWIAKERITITTGPLAAVRELLSQFPAHERMPHLRLLQAGAEALQQSDVALFQKCSAPGCVLSGEYGATETLGGFQSYRVDHTMPLTGERIPAGYSQDGFAVLILDDAGNPLPPGQTGEIVARSPYLAEGYWGQHDLTATRFRPDPTDPHQRLYFTGDLGKVEPDGCLIHLGRKDNQLKIRGYLVEPIEVERALIALGHYREVVVDARPNRWGEPVLVAWLVAEGSPLSVWDVRSQLARVLPYYMIPTHYLPMDTLPQTVAGKVDRRALPDPAPVRPALSTDYRPPTTPLEEWLVSCWEEVLGVQPIGADDNFFELGGNSLQAMRIVVRLRDRFDDWFYVAILFGAPTVAALATHIVGEYLSRQDRTPKASTALAKSEAPIVDDTASRLAHFRSHFVSARSHPGLRVKNPSAIFILAPGRSGTTLLRVMLGGHPRLFAPPELFLLDYDTVAEWLAGAIDGHSFRREGVLQALMQIHKIGLEDAERIVTGYAETGASTQYLYRHIQQQIAPRLLIDKTPSYAHTQGTLRMAEREFDQPRYIHLLRHPCAVVDSYVGVRFDHLNPAPRILGLTAQRYAELNWLFTNQNISAFLHTIPSQRQTQVRFEELVNTPRPVMENLCTFLGLAFDDEMLHPYRDSQQRMTDGIHALTAMAGDPKFHTHNAIEPSAAVQWQEGNTAGTLSDSTWEMAATLGYPHFETRSIGR